MFLQTENFCVPKCTLTSSMLASQKFPFVLFQSLLPPSLPPGNRYPGVRYHRMVLCVLELLDKENHTVCILLRLTNFTRIMFVRFVYITLCTWNSFILNWCKVFHCIQYTTKSTRLGHFGIFQHFYQEYSEDFCVCLLVTHLCISVWYKDQERNCRGRECVICSVLADTASFLKWLYQFKHPF